jgi:hypothetical protein
MATKRDVRAGSLQPKPEDTTPTKAMYLFPKALLRNVELCAWVQGKTKTAVVRDAIASYLADQGISEPFKMPKGVTLKWD